MNRRTPQPRGSGPIGGGRQAQLASYSRRVRWMKLLLPLGAVALVGAIFLMGRDLGGTSGLLSPMELARLGAGLKIDSLRFSGETEAGEPFEIRAVSAVPDQAQPERIDLDQPVGEIAMQDGRRVTARAAQGRLYRSSRRVELDGAVEIETSDGYRITTERAEMLVEERRLHAPGPVRGEGPRGSIQAGSMRAHGVDDDSAATKIWFENGVRLVFIPG